MCPLGWSSRRTLIAELCLFPTHTRCHRVRQAPASVRPFFSLCFSLVCLTQPHAGAGLGFTFEHHWLFFLGRFSCSHWTTGDAVDWIHGGRLSMTQPKNGRLSSSFLQPRWISLNTNLYLLLFLWFLTYCCFCYWRWLLWANRVFLFGVATLSGETGICFFFSGLPLSSFLKFLLLVLSYSSYFLR